MVRRVPADAVGCRILANDPGRPGVTLLSVTPGSGKSLLSRSLAVLRRQTGQSVSIYKPVVVAAQPVSTSRGLVDITTKLAAMAVGSDDVADVCDFVVSGGRLHRIGGGDMGPAPMISEDGVDFPELPAAVRDDIERTCSRRVSSADRYLICEGAGGAVDLPEPDDVSNGRLATYAARPVVLVISARHGGAAAAMLGSQKLLPGSVDSLIAGFIVNNADRLVWGDRLAGRVSAATGWPCLGAIPRIPLYAQLPPRGSTSPAAGSWEEELLTVAEFVADHVDDRLHRAGTGTVASSGGS